MSSIGESETEAGNNKTNSGEVQHKFACSATNCNQTFTSKERLLVHEQKHQMTLKLGVKSANYLSEALTVDQTPTPTRFLQYGNQVGLFDELTNPFDRDFKAAQKEGAKAFKSRNNQFSGIANKVRTPTSPSAKPTESSFHVPMQLIALTPSPVAHPNQFFVPPLIHSPQPMVPSLPGFSGASSPMSMAPNHLISPIMQYPSFMTVMENQQRAAAAMFAAANVQQQVSSPSANVIQNPFLANHNAHAAAAAAVTTANNNQPHHHHQVVSQQNSEPKIDGGAAAGVSGLNFIPKQERPSSTMSVDRLQQQQNNDDDDCMITSSTSSSNIKPATSTNLSLHIPQPPAAVVTQQHGKKMQQIAPPNMIHQPPSTTTMANNIANEQQLSHINLHNPTQQHINALQEVAKTITEQYQQNSAANSSSTMVVDAKQKLKETLKINNPRLLQQQQQNNGSSAIVKESASRTHSNDSTHQQLQLNNTTSSSTSSTSQQQQVDVAAIKTDVGEPGNGAQPSAASATAGGNGRRRGRQSRDIDPDVKRQRFLERNRAAASRCRNKKKKWVHGLEQKAKNLSQTNLMLQTEIGQLKNEVASLKQLLLSHRDCPVTKMQQQQIGFKFDMLAAVTGAAGTSSTSVGCIDVAAGSSSSSSVPTTIQPVKLEVNAGQGMEHQQMPLGRVPSLASLTNSSNPPSVSSVTSQQQAPLPPVNMQQPDQMVYPPPSQQQQVTTEAASNSSAAGIAPIYQNRACT